MHNVRIFPSGTIPGHYVVTPERLRMLDELSKRSLNSDGMSCTPTAPIVIGGAGVRATGGTAKATGLIRTGRDAVGIQCTGSNVPTFNGTSRTRTILFPLNEIVPDYNFIARPTSFQHISTPYYGIKSISDELIPWIVTIDGLRLHRTATLKSVTLRFRNGRRNADIYTAGTFPQLIVQKIAPDSVSTVTLFKAPAWQATHAYAVDDIVVASNGAEWENTNGYSYRCVVAGTSSGTQPTWSTTLAANQTDGGVTWRVQYGFVDADLNTGLPRFPHGQDIGLYHNNGLPQDVVYPCNRNNTLNSDGGLLYAKIVDPGVLGNVYHSLAFEITGIADFREP